MHILLCFTFLRDEKSKNKSWRSSQLFQEAQKGKPVVQEFLPMIWINTRQRPHASAKSAWALLTDQQTAVCSPEIQDEICRELGVEGWGLLWAKQAGKGGVRHRNEGNVQMAVGRGVNHRQMLQEQHHLAHKNEMLIFSPPFFLLELSCTWCWSMIIIYLARSTTPHWAASARARLSSLLLCAGTATEWKAWAQQNSSRLHPCRGPNTQLCAINFQRNKQKKPQTMPWCRFTFLRNNVKYNSVRLRRQLLKKSTS